MKFHSGRWVIIALLVVCVAVGLVLYRVFKESGNYTGLVLAQMQKEFLDYSQQQHQNQDKIQVADYQGKIYFVDLKKNWNFDLHDKLLVVTAPALEPAAPAADQSVVEKKAIEEIGKLLQTWIQDKFHTLKDITFQVRF